MKKKLLITIDTEGDNFWEFNGENAITTENVNYLPRFQKVCNDYGFKPTWLSNYEIIKDDKFIDFVLPYTNCGKAEIGMHLHAWNTPPYYELPKANDSLPYLIEYPPEVMEEKIAFMTDFIKIRTGITPKSHRAGRWATNDTYFDLLIKYGYLIDCSVTPYFDFSNCPGQTEGSCGNNYTDYPADQYTIKDNLLELPVTIVKTNRWFPKFSTPKEFARSAVHAYRGSSIWVRPDGDNLEAMKWVLRDTYKSKKGYAMFMIHSSELMPGGSPTFKTKESIEKLYADLNSLFKYAEEMFDGVTLYEYYTEKIQK